MRSVGFILIALLFVARAEAATYNYKDYWKHSEIQVPDASVSLYVKNSPLPFLKGIANITVSKNNKQPLEKIVNFIKSSSGLKEWNLERMDGLNIYEAVDPKTGNLFRLATNPKTNEYSFGAVKLRYLMPSYVEMHLLQVEKLTGANSKKTAEMLLDLLMPKAYAVDLSGYRAQGTQALTQAGNYVETVGTNIVGNGLHNGLADTNTAMRDSANTLSQGAQNAAATLGTDVKQAATVAGGSVDNLAGSVREASHDTNATINKQLSTANVAKLAAVGATTGVLVSAITTFAISGAWDLAKKAYYEAMGEFDPRRKNDLLGQFETALKTFRDLGPQAEMLQRRLDLLTKFIDPPSNQTTEETLALWRKDRARRMGKTEANYEDCLDCLEPNKEPKLRGLHSNVADVQDALSAKAASCQEINDLAIAWEQTEADLNKARYAITENARVYIGFLPQVAEVDDFQKERKMNNACNADDAEKKLRKISSEASRLGCEQGKNASHSVCLDYQTYNQMILNCKMLAGVESGPGVKAAMRRDAAVIGSRIAELSVTLSKMDCDQRDGNACAKPGVFTQVSLEMKNKFDALRAKCPGGEYIDRMSSRAEASRLGISSSQRPVPVPASAGVAAPAVGALQPDQVAKAEPPPTGFFAKFGNLFKRMFSGFTNQNTANRTADDYKQNALHPYYGGQ